MCHSDRTAFSDTTQKVISTYYCIVAFRNVWKTNHTARGSLSHKGEAPQAQVEDQEATAQGGERRVENGAVHDRHPHVAPDPYINRRVRVCSDEAPNRCPVNIN